jgi:2-dehydropantoate 2-reductase
MLWEKMLWNAPFNAICALTGLRAGEALSCCEVLVRKAMEEVVCVARAEGVSLEPALIDTMLELTRVSFPLTEPDPRARDIALSAPRTSEMGTSTRPQRR